MLQRKKRFTALMAFDDLTADGSIRALYEGGVKVPEHCFRSVGFDAVPLYFDGCTILNHRAAAPRSDGNHAVNIVMEGVISRP